LESAATLFQNAKSTVQGASTKTLTSFEKATSQVTKALNKGGTDIANSLSNAARFDTSGQLSQALHAEPSCEFLSETSSTTTTSG
jgi:hypothetical protein